MTGILPEPFDAIDRVTHADLMWRLAWHHGVAGATEILAGDDPLTNLDIAKWNALGAAKTRSRHDQS